MSNKIIFTSRGMGFQKSLKSKKYKNGNCTGASHELLVCSDLLSKGFEVYRSVSSTGYCDLIVINFETKEILRIEVTTGTIGNLGYISFPKKDKKKYDVLAVIVDNQVYYHPTTLF